MSEYALWSRTTLGILFATIIIGLVVAYVSFQARFLLLGPQLVLKEEPAVVSNDRFITLNGHATNITRITLNGRQIFTDQSGYFNEEMMLENGYTIATVAASDRFGRTTELVREFMYFPASVTPSITEVINN